MNSVWCGGDGQDLQRIWLIPVPDPGATPGYHLDPSRGLTDLPDGPYNVEQDPAVFGFQCTWDLAFTPSTPSSPAEASEGKTAAPSTSAFGLPFPGGTTVSLGGKGLHDDNFSSLPGGYTLAGAGDVTDASLDLLAPVDSPVIPLADGIVVKAWPRCGVVLVDHGGGTWVEYLHLSIEVTDQSKVTRSTVPGDRSTVLGYVLPQLDPSATPDPTCGTLESSAAHVHIAFLEGNGKNGRYASMNGQVLCGHSVNGAGDVVGLGTAGGAAFPVSDCGMAATATASSGASSGPGGAGAPTIKIGSSGFYEAQLMAEIYAQALEANDFTVDRAGIGIGARKVSAPALESGQFDLEPEYIGYFLAFYEPGKQTGDPKANATELQSVLRAKGGGITVLSYSPAADQPGDNLAPLVRNDYLAKLPNRDGFEKILNDISAKMNTPTLTALDKEIAVDRKDIALVAKSWLTTAGFPK